jgi:hypothetical protein
MSEYVIDNVEDAKIGQSAWCTMVYQHRANLDVNVNVCVPHVRSNVKSMYIKELELSVRRLGDCCRTTVS